MTATTTRPATRTGPITPAMVEAELRRLCGLADALADDLDTLARDAAEAEADYRLCKARAVLASEAGSADRRDAAALDECAEAFTRHLSAAAALNAATERARLLRSQLDAVRSVGASVRTALEASS